jgi:hypothetical protein
LISVGFSTLTPQSSPSIASRLPNSIVNPLVFSSQSPCSTQLSSPFLLYRNTLPTPVMMYHNFMHFKCTIQWFSYIQSCVGITTINFRTFSS